MYRSTGEVEEVGGGGESRGSKSQPSLEASVFASVSTETALFSGGTVEVELAVVLGVGVMAVVVSRGGSVGMRAVK